MENSGTQIYPSHRFLHFLSLDSLLSLTVIPYIYIFISIYKYQISDHFLWIPTSKIKIPALSTSSIIWLGFGVSDLGFWLTFLGFRVSSWVRNGDFVPLSCHCCSGNFCFFFLSLSLSLFLFFFDWNFGVMVFQVGAYFVGQYYQVLQQQPDFVHQFYSDASTVLRVDGNTRETASAMLVILLNFVSIGMVVCIGYWFWWFFQNEKFWDLILPCHFFWWIIWCKIGIELVLF